MYTAISQYHVCVCGGEGIMCVHSNIMCACVCGGEGVMYVHSNIMCVCVGGRG